MKNQTDDLGVLYKILNEDGSARMGNGKWPLPANGKPGEWLRVDGKLLPCENGLHLCRRKDLLSWLGPVIWTAEYRGDDLTVCDDKIVVREARLIGRLTTWNEKTARLFACDCAERALSRIKDPDPRSTNAIKVTRLFAKMEATKEELAAARDAAQVATARDAAQVAAWGATARDAAQVAAWVAARAATAWAAARAATAWAAERQWQTERLFEYLDGKRG